MNSAFKILALWRILEYKRNRIKEMIKQSMTNNIKLPSLVFDIEIS